MNAVALAPAALAIFFLANVAQADLFQFIRQSTGSYVSLAPVFINGNFIGSTDQHGRIDIQIPPGQYQLTIRLRQDIYDKTISITGNTALQVVYF